MVFMMDAVGYMLAYTGLVSQRIFVDKSHIHLINDR